MSTPEFWVFAIVTFLFVLSVVKYTDLDKLRESIEDYAVEVAFRRTGVDLEEDDVMALEEIRDMIEDYVIRNPKIFSKLVNNDTDGADE